jgi:molybdenum cofactor cytidylyltransferase
VLSAIVLAAGLSRRMGGPNKLLLPLAGAPLVRRTVDALSRHPFAEIVVVTGHDAPNVEEALRGAEVRLVHNAAYEDGQMSSVRAGLAALSVPSMGVVVALGDQPLLTPEDLATLAAAFLAHPECQVLVPTFQGARGNPIVLSRANVANILARSGNFGCRQFVEKNQELVTTFEMPNDHVLRDVDRPEDYAALLTGPPPPLSS